MLQGQKIALRTIRPEELNSVYQLISDVSRKGPYWHLDVPSEHAFRKDYAENGCWGTEEGRLLITRGTPDGEPIGEVLAFKGLDYQSGPEIGYELFQESDYGHGYMPEALQLFCAWLFNVRPINRIQVNLMTENTGSRRVAEKCGFSFEGTMRAATFHRGRYHDLALFSLLREECASLDELIVKQS